MESDLENLDINGSGVEITEIIDRFYFWIDTRETSDDKAINSTFLTAVGKGAFTLLKILVHPKNSRGTSGSRQASFMRWPAIIMKLCMPL